MAVTYMTEILLIVTLKNQFTSPYKTMHFTVPMQRGLCFTLIETLLPIIECDVRGKYTKRRGQRTPDFLNLCFAFRDKNYTV